MKTNVEMQMNMVPTNMTYIMALSNYRNVVNQKFPAKGSNNKRSTRRIQAAGNQGRGGQGTGRDNQGRGGRGQGRGRGGRGNGRTDAWEVVGINGKRVQVHPAFRFETEQWFNIP